MTSFGDKWAARSEAQRKIESLLPEFRAARNRAIEILSEIDRYRRDEASLSSEIDAELRARQMQHDDVEADIERVRSVPDEKPPSMSASPKGKQVPTVDSEGKTNVRSPTVLAERVRLFVEIGGKGSYQTLRGNTKAVAVRSWIDAGYFTKVGRGLYSITQKARNSVSPNTLTQETPVDVSAPKVTSEGAASLLEPSLRFVRSLGEKGVTSREILNATGVLQSTVAAWVQQGYLSRTGDKKPYILHITEKGSLRIGE